MERNKICQEVEPAARAKLADPPCITAPILELDIQDAGLASLIWATGYTFDFGWIDLPVLNASGEAVHEHGVAPVPGVYFLGLPWLSQMSSSFLSGVGDDAARIAEHIHRRTAAAPRI